MNDVDSEPSSDTISPPLHRHSSDRPMGRPTDWPPEFGGPKGPEPTRYGDWERNGRVSDF